MGDYLGELLSVYLASVVEIIDVIAKVIAIIDYVAWSVMEWAILGLIDICWPRFSLSWETKGVVGYEDLEDVSERLRQQRVRLPLWANWAFKSVVARRRNIVVLRLRLRRLDLRLRWRSLNLQLWRRGLRRARICLRSQGLRNAGWLGGRGG